MVAEPVTDLESLVIATEGEEVAGAVPLESVVAAGTDDVAVDAGTEADDVEATVVAPPVT